MYVHILLLVYESVGINILLIKTTAAQNGVALIYHKVRALFSVGMNRYHCKF